MIQAWTVSIPVVALPTLLCLQVYKFDPTARNPFSFLTNIAVTDTLRFGSSASLLQLFLNVCYCCEIVVG